MNSFIKNQMQVTKDLVTNSSNGSGQVRCSCGRFITSPWEIEVFEGIGMCLVCEHLRSDHGETNADHAWNDCMGEAEA